MRKTKIALAVIVIGALLFFQSGCLGPSKTPPTRFFVLSSLSIMEPAPAALADLSHLSIGVGPVRIPGKIDRPQVVVQSDRNEIRLAGLTEWGDPTGHYLQYFGNKKKRLKKR